MPREPQLGQRWSSARSSIFGAEARGVAGVVAEKLTWVIGFRFSVHVSMQERQDETRSACRRKPITTKPITEHGYTSGRHSADRRVPSSPSASHGVPMRDADLF